MSITRRTTWTLLPAAVAAALAFTACSGPTAESPASPAAEATEQSESPTPSEPGDQDFAGPACTPDQFDISITRAPEPVDGKLVDQFVLVNSGEECSLVGTPIVEPIDAAGTPLTPPSAEVAGEPAVQTVSAGGSVSFDLSLVDIGEDGGELGAGCVVTPAVGWNVWLPEGNGMPEADTPVVVETPEFNACNGDTPWLEATEFADAS